MRRWSNTNGGIIQYQSSYDIMSTVVEAYGNTDFDTDRTPIPYL